MANAPIAEDENTVTLQGPNGPMIVAKAGLQNPSSYGSSSVLQNNSSYSTNPVVQNLALRGQEKSQADFQNELRANRGIAPIEPAAPLTLALGEPGPLVASTGELPAAAMPKVQDANPMASPEGGSQAAPTPTAQPQPGTQSTPSSPFSAGFNLSKKAINEGIELGQKKAAEQLTFAQEQAKNAEQFKNDQIARDAAKEKFLNDAEAKRLQAEDTERKFAFKDYWADRSTGSKILAAISVGLGAYSSTMSGGPNQAASIIDGAIKRDADLQQKQYEQLKGNTRNAESAYGRIYQRVQDKDLAAKQTYITMLEASKAKFEASIAKYGGQEAKVNGMKSLAELQTKIDGARAEYGLKVDELHAKQSGAKATKMENFVPALGRYATNKESAAKVNELAGATMSARDGIGKLLEMGKKTGGSISPEARAEAETTASLVKAALRVPILGPGTVNDAERALMDRIVSNPLAIFSLDGVQKKRLETLNSRLLANLDNQSKAYLVPSEGGSSGTMRMAMVKIRLPDGQVGVVPEDKLDAALTRGAKVLN